MIIMITAILLSLKVVINPLHAVALSGFPTDLTSGGSGGRPGTVDKLLLPERYSGDKERWRMFSSKLISCLAKAHPSLEAAMTKEMGAHRPVTPEKISEYGLTEEAQACLGEQLTALLLGEAWIAIENPRTQA